MLYRTTPLFLKLFGLHSLDDLPDVSAWDPTPEEEAELRERLLQSRRGARAGAGGPPVAAAATIAAAAPEPVAGRRPGPSADDDEPAPTPEPEHAGTRLGRTDAHARAADPRARLSGGDDGHGGRDPDGAGRPRRRPALVGHQRVDARLTELTLLTSAVAGPTRVRVLLPAGYARAAAPLPGALPAARRDRRRARAGPRRATPRRSPPAGR